MKTVPIPGGTAQLRERSELRGRDELLIKAASMAAAKAVVKVAGIDDTPKDGETKEEATARAEEEAEAVDLTWQESLSLLELRQAVIVAVLEHWTLDRSLPTMATIGDLPAELYNALDEAIGGEAIEMGTNFVAPDSPAELKLSPTGDSESSDTALRDGVENQSIQSSPDGTESTATDLSIPA